MHPRYASIVRFRASSPPPFSSVLTALFRKPQIAIASLRRGASTANYSGKQNFARAHARVNERELAREPPHVFRVRFFFFFFFVPAEVKSLFKVFGAPKAKGTLRRYFKYYPDLALHLRPEKKEERTEAYLGRFRLLCWRPREISYKNGRIPR